MIDGLSNNNIINPGANGGALTASPDGYSPTDLPAGGVVDARLKDPSMDRASGKVSWRTTRNAWTSYHIDANKKEAFEAATTFYNQPKFTKNFYSATFNQPLNDSAGVIFSYNRQQSTIPQYHSNMQKWTDQERLSETYLLKGTWFADNGDILRLTVMYSHTNPPITKQILKTVALPIMAAVGAPIWNGNTIHMGETDQLGGIPARAE